MTPVGMFKCGFPGDKPEGLEGAELLGVKRFLLVIVLVSALGREKQGKVKRTDRGEERGGVVFTNPPGKGGGRK